MKTEIKEIPFDNGTLLGVRTSDGKVWLAVKKACLDIGLSDGQARKQVENIQEEAVLKSNCRYLAIVQKEGKRDVKREQLFLNEDVITLWLAKITLTDKMKEKNPKAYDTLINYQLKAAKVLHEAFYETEEQKAALHSSLGLEGQIATLEQKLEMTVIQLNNVENTLDIQNERLNAVMDNMTLTTTQQGMLQRAVKDRVNHLLGGAHSKEYKENSKLYFINLWGGLKERFNCGSRWQDLNPKYYNEAFDYVSAWEYVEA